jgi:D-aspartate ligase
LSIIDRPAFDSSVPVLVLKTGGSLGQHGVLGIARSLGRLGVPVYWAHSDPGAPAARSRYLAGTFDWVLDHSNPESAVERLLQIARELGRPAILIPTEDGSSVLVAEQAQALREHFIFPAQSPELVGRLASKREMHALSVEHGVDVPRSSFPESSADVLEFAERTGYPVVVKRAEGWRPQRGTGRKSVAIARNRVELLRAYDEMESPESPNILLQAYIPGTSESIWMFNGYFDESSNCLVGFTGQKIRQDPIETGPTTLGVCMQNHVVAETTRRLMKAIGYRGILDMGYRYDARDGSYNLLDVNPRIGSSFRLFVGQDGMDVVRALYLDLTGQPVAARAPRDGRRWINEPLDLISSVRNVRKGNLTVGEWRNSLSGVEEGGWFARDDPLPAALVWLRYGALALEKLGGRSRRAVSPERSEPQSVVNEHFEEASASWDEIYRRSDVYAVIHQERRLRVLDWVDGLGLEAGASVLEVGCGAGLTSLTLAQNGFEVDATDSVDAMIERARERAVAAGVSERLRTSIADVHALRFEDEAFDLALAMGVIPWLHSPATALGELSRVLKPGGYLIVNADNRLRLTQLFDPRRNPWLAPARRPARRILTGLGVVTADRTGPEIVQHLSGEFDTLLDSVGLERIDSATLGFGPFTFWNREILSARRAVGFHSWLQRHADRGFSGLRSTGSQYLVLARKRPRG